MLTDLRVPEDSNDDTPVQLNENQIAVFERSYAKIGEVLGWIRELSKTDGLTVSSIHNAISIATSKLGDMGNALGYNNKQEEEIKTELIRGLHEKIKRLEEAQGDSYSLEGFGVKLHQADKMISNYWRSLGLGNLVDVHFSSHYSAMNAKAEAELYVMIEKKHHDIFEYEPVTNAERKQEQIKELKLNLELYDDSPNSENGLLFVLNTPENTEFIFRKLKDKFPTSTVSSFVSQYIYKTELHRIHKVDLSIPVTDLLEELENERQNDS